MLAVPLRQSTRLLHSPSPSGGESGAQKSSPTPPPPPSKPTTGSSSPMPYPIVLQTFLHAYNDGSKDVMEPFLHHNFVFEQAPVLPAQPKYASLFKYDFLRRTVDARGVFASRTVEVTQMVMQGTIVVVESKARAVLAMDVPKVGKKGDRIEVFATTWFEFDAATQTILKMKAYECLSPP